MPNLLFVLIIIDKEYDEKTMVQFKKLVKGTYNKLFLDKNGRFVVSQWPNWPLWVWIASLVLAKIIKNGLDFILISWAGTIALVYWAYLELFYGVNYFRRILGLVVLGYIILNKLF